MKKTFLERFTQDPKNKRLFLQERSILEVTELIEEKMRELGITRAELATRLSKSKSWVTQLLDKEGNKTIRTVADVFAVLGFEFHAYTQPIRISGAADNNIFVFHNFDIDSASAAAVINRVKEQTLHSSPPASQTEIITPVTQVMA